MRIVSFEHIERRDTPVRNDKEAEEILSKCPFCESGVKLWHAPYGIGSTCLFCGAQGIYFRGKGVAEWAE